MIAIRLCVHPTLECRGRAPKHSDRSLVTRPNDSNIAGMVARRLVLLVARFVLFIDDDGANVVQRRKDGGARADRDAPLAALQRAPGVDALAVAKRRMQDGDLVAEDGTETVDCLRCERNLGNKNDGGTSAPLDDLAQDVEVDERLAAPRDAVQEEDFAQSAARDGIDSVALRVGRGVSSRGLSAALTLTGGGGVLETSSADELLTTLYTTHYRDLVRLAAFLTGDRDNAEEVVQDAYVKMHASWRRVRELDKAEAYLRTTVVNLSRSRLRHRQVTQKHRPEPLVDTASAESFAMQHAQRDTVLQALHALPRRQREAVVLRYYGDLTEAQTAAAMGCSVGAVKSHTSRAMAALRPLLEGAR